MRYIWQIYLMMSQKICHKTIIIGYINDQWLKLHSTIIIIENWKYNNIQLNSLESLKCNSRNHNLRAHFNFIFVYNSGIRWSTHRFSYFFRLNVRNEQRRAKTKNEFKRKKIKSKYEMPIDTCVEHYLL